MEMPFVPDVVNHIVKLAIQQSVNMYNFVKTFIINYIIFECISDDIYIATVAVFCWLKSILNDCSRMRYHGTCWIWTKVATT